MKGGSRLAGLNSLGEYTHNFETYLTALQQKPVPMDESFFAMLNQRQDEITRRVEVYRKLVQGEASADELASLSQAVEPEPVAASGLEGPSQNEVSATKEVNAETEETKSSATQSQEMVRVSSDLLEELIGLSGESNICLLYTSPSPRDS